MILNQVLNELELVDLETRLNHQTEVDFSELTDLIKPAHKDYVSKMAYRYEQILLKEFSDHLSLPILGVNLAEELMKNVKEL